jgi:site-specific DNA-cytosine methylase
MKRKLESLERAVSVAERREGGREPVRVLEFFSGIGGWRSALARVLPQESFQVVAAFEINDIANSVYNSFYNESPVNVCSDI